MAGLPAGFLRRAVNLGTWGWYRNSDRPSPSILPERSSSGTDGCLTETPSTMLVANVTIANRFTLFHSIPRQNNVMISAAPSAPSPPAPRSYPRSQPPHPSGPTAAWPSTFAAIAAITDQAAAAGPAGRSAEEAKRKSVGWLCPSAPFPPADDPLRRRQGRCPCARQCARLHRLNRRCRRDAGPG